MSHERHENGAITDRWIAGQSGHEVTFRLARPADASFILSLRTDSRLNEHLSSVDHDLEKQITWLQDYRAREDRGEEFYFVISRNGESVGTVRLYDVQEDSFCWGSWVIVPGTPPSVALRSAALIYDFGFNALGFRFSHFDVRKGNGSVNRFHQRTGAIVISEDSENFYYQIDKATALNATSKW